MNGRFSNQFIILVTKRSLDAQRCQIFLLYNRRSKHANMIIFRLKPCKFFHVNDWKSIADGSVPLPSISGMKTQWSWSHIHGSYVSKLVKKWIISWNPSTSTWNFVGIWSASRTKEAKDVRATQEWVYLIGNVEPVRRFKMPAFPSLQYKVETNRPQNPLA